MCVKHIVIIISVAFSGCQLHCRVKDLKIYPATKTLRVCVRDDVKEEKRKKNCEKKEKKTMIKHRTAGGRCQTDQLVLVIHNFSIKLDCRHYYFFVVFLYLEKKKKKKKGWYVPWCLAILFSNTVS